MRDDAKVKNNVERKREYEEREIEKKKRKEEKREDKRKRKAEKASAGDPNVPEEEKKEGDGENHQEEEMEIDVSRIEILVEEWVREIEAVKRGEEEEEDDTVGAWDDVHGGDLPKNGVRAARAEEVGYMQNRKIWRLKPIKECWDVTGKPPVSMRWVDTNKAWDGEHDSEALEIRSRMVARDFKGDDKDRDDLFAETPPLEAKRMLFSRAATRRRDGRMRKLLLIDARKAHLNPKCEQDVYVMLPEECDCPEGMCGKLDFWLYGFRPAAVAWEKHYSELLESVGFKRGVSCGVVFYNRERYFVSRSWR
jgi:hypothetical protein